MSVFIPSAPVEFSSDYHVLAGIADHRDHMFVVIAFLPGDIAAG
jgi:hypothetical protein